MKIAVIGTGKVGGTLGQRWHAAGHDVAYGSRAGSGEGPGGAEMIAVGDAIGDANVVVLAVPSTAVAEVVAANSAALFFAADPSARQVAEELISAVGLEPVSVGDAEASSMVDALLPLWFSLVRHNGGNRRVALRVVR